MFVSFGTSISLPKSKHYSRSGGSERQVRRRGKVLFFEIASLDFGELASLSASLYKGDILQMLNSTAAEKLL